MNDLKPKCSRQIYQRRRIVVAILNLTTVAIALAAMVVFLSSGGLGTVEWLMLGCFALTLPYTSVGFWNACIGFGCRWSSWFQPPPDYGLDNVSAGRSGKQLNTRTAIVMALRNETPDAVFERLSAIRASLAATNHAGAFRFVVLSDSDEPTVIEAERRAFEAFAAVGFKGGTPIYRRRAVNTGYKAGNIGEFLDAIPEFDPDGFDFFIPLDADSTITGPVLVQMVRAMEDHPSLGILQSLVVGQPSVSGFARIFQFGMRHAMRTFATGAAWWSGDCGEYWGHNAIIRTSPFRDYCRLPQVSGRSPLSGDVMSHDQLEAAYMRRAGYEVRVAPIETESFEINPPNLLDFIKRELRWCQGNLQYVFFLGRRGLKTVSRIQLALAMSMYIGPPAWIVMTICACAGGLGGILQTGSFTLGLSLFALILTLALSPKIIGALDVGLSVNARAQYAGGYCFGLSVITELLVSMIMAPIVATSITLFVVGLMLNRRVGWANQDRSATGVRWRHASAAMCPHTGFGVLLGATIVYKAGAIALFIATPFVSGLVLSIPFTVLSARTALGRYCAARGLFAIPEENRNQMLNLSVEAEAT